MKFIYFFVAIFMFYWEAATASVVTSQLNTSVLYTIGTVSGLNINKGDSVRVDFSYENSLNPAAGTFSDFRGLSEQSRLVFSLDKKIFDEEMFQISQSHSTQLGPFKEVDFVWMGTGPFDSSSVGYKTLEMFFFAPAGAIFNDYQSTASLVNDPARLLGNYYFGRINECDFVSGCNEITFGNVNPVSGVVLGIPEPPMLWLLIIALTIFLLHKNKLLIVARGSNN